MRARRLALACCVVFGLAGCGSRAPEVTGLFVTVDLGGVSARQLEIAVDTPTAQVIGPQRRPGTPGDALANPQSVSIFLPDALAGRTVTCTVTPFDGAQPSGPPVTRGTTLVLHKLVPLTIPLARGGDGGVDAASDGPVTPDGAAERDGAVDVQGDLGASDGPKGNGQRCTADAQCDSTMCVDGFCCNSACIDSCHACNLTGKEGTCSPIAAGGSPIGPKRAACVDQGAPSCGFDGTCDGNGACRRYVPGIGCKAATCDGASFVPAGACDGQGTCVTPKAVGCAPYNCTTTGPAACASTCTPTGGQCASPAVCTNGSCGTRPKKNDGDGCVANGDCSSSFCVDGVCCATACTGPCVSCSTGACENVATGKPDPHRICMDEGAASCGHDGLCDGNGACRLYPASTVCLAGSCKNNTTLSPGRRCDGNGACVTAADADCTPFRCDPAAAACFTTCTGGAQCVQHHPCLNNACLP